MLIVLVSALITVNQAVWIINMYNLHKKEMKDYANQSANQAVFMEISERGELLGGCKVFSTNLSEPNDTSRYIEKRVRTVDTTYVVTIDKQDPNSMNKIIQLVIKNDMPVDLKRLNLFFQKELSERYPIKNTYFDYLDLKKSKLIKSNKLANASSNYLPTDTITLDILNNIYWS